MNTNSWRTANTLKAFINQSLGFSKEFRMLFLSIYQPIQHNDKKTSNTMIFGMHTHNTRLRTSTRVVKNTCILIGITGVFFNLYFSGINLVFWDGMIQGH